jgi:diguanylate cyclase (GGDEF)-like protein/PAS domain S-box-containing protein
MTISALLAFFASNHVVSTGTLLASLLLALFAVAYAWMLNSRSSRAKRQMEERTSELLRANQALRLSQRAIEASANAIVITSAVAPDYPVEYVNPAFERIAGYSAAEIQGKSLQILSAGEPDQPGLKTIAAARREQREAHVVLRCYRKDGTLFWSEVHIAPVRDEDGKVGHFVVMKYDISANKSYEAELEYRANYDVLTGLANRHRLRTRLQLAIVQAARYAFPVWVVSMDLDRFKVINDSLGHRAGDLVLREIAMRLQSTVRESDTLARLGGDEFVLVLPLESEKKPGMAVLQRLLAAIALPLKVREQDIFPTCSLGLAVYPDNGSDPDALVECADIAMYRAKEAGGDNFQFFNPAMNERVMERLQLEAELRNALEREEFELHYQPQVSLLTGRITGVEALIRWNHPELGRVAPDRFIALAEETGLIVPIGAWVLATACRQNKTWQDAGFDGLRIAVNLSARQFAGQDLMRAIAAALSETGLKPGQLELELTESLVMSDVGQAITTMRELKALGVQLSIDDFGTGYSSLSYLKQFPIDILKIDRTFVRDITNNADDAAVVRAVISMAHSLRLEVVAEGVETLAQLDYLRQHGCDRMQGYLFSRPLPAEELAALLRQGRRLPGLTACVQ